MPKLRILDPNGVHFGGRILPKDSEHDIAKGPHSDAWLRFKQAEVVPENPAKPERAERGDASAAADAGGAKTVQGAGKKPDAPEGKK